MAELDRLGRFDEAFETINTQRTGAYGHPRQHFRRSSALKDVVKECKHPEARHALEMICDKMARLIENPYHEDSWLDIAGYARTGVMVTDDH